MITLQRPMANQSFGLIKVYVDPAYRALAEQALHAAQKLLRYGTLSLRDQVPPDGSPMLLVASRYNLVNIGQGGATLRVRLSQIGDVADDLERLSRITDWEIGDVTDDTIGDKTVDVPARTPRMSCDSPMTDPNVFSFSSEPMLQSFSKEACAWVDYEMPDRDLEESVEDLRSQITGLLARLMRMAKKAGMTDWEVMGLFKQELRGTLVLTRDGISRVTVNDKDEIILSDYNEMEILKGRGIQKTLYYFFLLHPEGVRLSEFGCHIGEFERIYSHLWPIKAPVREKLSRAVTIGALSYISKLNSRIQMLFPAWDDNPYLVKKDARTGRYKLGLPADKIVFTDRNWFLTGRG